MEQSNATETNVQPQISSSFSFAGLAQVFYAPAAFFEKLKNNPKILVPYLFFVLLIFAGLYIMVDIIVDFQANSPQLQERLQGQPVTPQIRQIMKLQTIVGGPIVMGLLPLLAAAMALFWGNFVMAGQARFRQILSVMLYGGMVYAAGLVVQSLMVVAKGSIKASLSLAVLVADKAPDSLPYVALSKIGLFTIWEIVAVGIGLSIIYGFSRNKGYLLSVLSVGMLSILHVAMTAIFSS